MNSLAASFIVEIDEMLYRAVLTNHQKAAYRDIATRNQLVKNPESIMSYCRLIGMIWFYFVWNHIIHLPFREFGQKMLQLGLVPFLVQFGLATAVQEYLMQRSLAPWIRACRVAVMFFV